jgi:hypothetical protein
MINALGMECSIILLISLVCVVISLRFILTLCSALPRISTASPSSGVAHACGCSPLIPCLRDIFDLVPFAFLDVNHCLKFTREKFFFSRISLECSETLKLGSSACRFRADILINLPSPENLCQISTSSPSTHFLQSQ